MVNPQRIDDRTQPEPERPGMTAGYGIHAGAEGLLPWTRVSERMAAARNYWIATTRPDGRPHVMPVWGLWLDEAFVFSTDPSSRKARNFSANPHIVVHLESGDDVVVLEGVIEPLTDPAILAQFVDAYDAKYRFRPETGNPAQGIYRFHLHTALAWHETDFPASATRWRFERTST